MRKILMLIGVAAMATATASMAEAKGRGNNSSARSHQAGNGHNAGRHARPRVRNDTGSMTRNHERRRPHQRNSARGHPHGCPPGLADRRPACVPPGQANRMFAEGQRLPEGYRYFTDYDDIPLTLREQYELEAAQRYILRDNSLYIVDPTTRLVSRIIDLLD